jgi:N-acetylglucosamine-6-phosphate deacetylase
VAPELHGALDMVARLRERGVKVSIGHTEATPDEAAAAVRAGASMVTHLFNAMRPFAHRHPNVPAWALTARWVWLGVIADGFHIDPLVLRLIARAAPDRVVLVTDSTPAADAPPGRYRMGTVEVENAGGRAVDKDGRLAGSVLTLDEAVRRWSGFTGQSLARAWAAASERPARAIGIRCGLREGFPADLVLLTAGGEVRKVMRRGEWVA